MPTVLCTPAAVATFSFVPTPSVQETSTGILDSAGRRADWRNRAETARQSRPPEGARGAMCVRCSSRGSRAIDSRVDVEIDARILVSGFGHSTYWELPRKPRL